MAFWKSWVVSIRPWAVNVQHFRELQKTSKGSTQNVAWMSRCFHFFTLVTFMYCKSVPLTFGKKKDTVRVVPWRVLIEFHIKLIQMFCIHPCRWQPNVVAWKVWHEAFFGKFHMRPENCMEKHPWFIYFGVKKLYIFWIYACYVL